MHRKNQLKKIKKEKLFTHQIPVNVSSNKQEQKVNLGKEQAILDACWKQSEIANRLKTKLKQRIERTKNLKTPFSKRAPIYMMKPSKENDCKILIIEESIPENNTQNINVPIFSTPNNQLERNGISDSLQFFNKTRFNTS